MKYLNIPQSVCLTGLLVLAGAFGAHAANIFKTTTTTMSASGDWSSSSTTLTGLAMTTASVGEFNGAVTFGAPRRLNWRTRPWARTPVSAVCNLTPTWPARVTILSGSTLTLDGNLTLEAGSPNVTINCAMSEGNNSSTWTVASAGTTLTVPSPGFGTATWTFAGAGNFNFGSANIQPGNNNGAVTITTTGSFSANDISIGKDTTTTTVPTATSPVAASANSGFSVTGAGSVVNISTFELSTQNGGAQALISAGTVMITNTVTLGHSSSGSRGAYFEVSGGSLTVSNTTSGMTIAENDGSTANLAEFYVAGGTASVGKITFGLASDTTGGTGWLIVDGSSANLYIGSGGIVKNTPYSGFNLGISLNTGLLGAWSSWSSSLPMQLAGTAAPFTIQAADASANAHNITLSGVLSGAGTLKKTGAGTLTLSGANTYTGTNILNAGIVNVGVAEVSGTSGPLGKPATPVGSIYFGGGTLQYSSANQYDYSGRFSIAGAPTQPISVDLNNEPVTFATAIQGANTSLTVADSSVGGGGVLSLTAANTYAGPTILNSGTLNVNGSGSIAGSGVTVSGGVLGGSGTVSSAVTVTTGGIAPGISGAGTLNLASSLNLGATATNNFGFTSSSVNAQAVVTGALTVTDTTEFNLYLAGGILPWTTPGTYNLIQFGSLTGGSLDSTWTTASGSNPHINNPQPHLNYAFGVGGPGGNWITLTIGSSVDNDVWAIGDFTDNWSNPSAWTATTGSTPPQNAGDTATFASDTAQYSVTLDQAETVGGITMNNPYSTVILSSGNTLTLDNAGSPSVVAVGGGSANVINPPVALNNNVTVTVGGGEQLSLAGGIANGANGPVTLTVNGAGTTVLPLANSYGPSSATAVGTTLSGGVLQVGNSSSLSTGELNVTSSGTLQAGAAGLSVGNNLVVNPGATVTVNNGGNPLTLGGVISGAGSLNSIGTGTLVLGAANTYAGGTTISGGTMFYTAVVSISADGATTGSAGSLGAVPTVATPDNIILNGGDFVGTANLTLHANRGVGIGSTSPANVGSFTGLIDAAAGTTLTVNGIIASAGNLGQQNLTVNGGAGNSGTVVLGNANTFNGLTTIYNGTLTLGNANALQASTLDYLGLGGTLSFGTLTSATFGNLEGTQNLSLMNAASTPAAVSLTVGNASSTTYSGGLSGTGASLTKQGSGTLNLTGANTYTGSTTCNGGELEPLHRWLHHHHLPERFGICGQWRHFDRQWRHILERQCF